MEPERADSLGLWRGPTARPFSPPRSLRTEPNLWEAAANRPTHGRASLETAAAMSGGGWPKRAMQAWEVHLLRPGDQAESQTERVATTSADDTASLSAAASAAPCWRIEAGATEMVARAEATGTGLHLIDRQVRRACTRQAASLTAPFDPRIKLYFEVDVFISRAVLPSSFVFLSVPSLSHSYSPSICAMSALIFFIQYPFRVRAAAGLCG